MSDPRIIVALDGLVEDGIFHLAEQLKSVPGVWGAKLNDGLRHCGYHIIHELHELGLKVMADLKLHDIPNTTKNDCLRLIAYSPELVTVHASGGIDMMKAAVETLRPVETKVLAITVLTSLDDGQCRQVYGKGTEQKVLEFAQDAALAGCWGVVCSPKELEYLRRAKESGLLSTELHFVTPGVRPSNIDLPGDDQQRVATISGAIAGGADLLVIGRPIVRAEDPVAAAERFGQEVEEALAAMAAYG